MIFMISEVGSAVYDTLLSPTPLKIRHILPPTGLPGSMFTLELVRVHGL